MRRYASKDKLETLVFQHKNKKQTFYDAFKEDIAVVSFYYDKQTVIQYEKSLSLTFVGFLSKVSLCVQYTPLSFNIILFYQYHNLTHIYNITLVSLQVGGNIGFGLGLSLVSVAEIIYWFTLRIYRNSNNKWYYFNPCGWCYRGNEISRNLVTLYGKCLLNIYFYVYS